MVNIQKLKYKIALITEDGKQYDLTDLTEAASWEENAGELAVHMSLSLVNLKTGGKYLSDLAKPGAMAVISASWGGAVHEVARGIISEWSPSFSGGVDTLDLVAYDELYTLQQCQDNAYFSAGTGTKTAIEKLFGDWGIPIEKYDGPDVPHAKTVFKAYISEMILSLLNDSVSLGAKKCVLRCTKGKVSILPRGSNTEIYHFTGDNATVASDKLSMSGLVTRVKVVGKEDKAGRQAVESVLDGNTDFGIRQRIYSRQDKDTLDAALKEAQKILDESGTPAREIRLEAPDVPIIRRGDKVYVTVGTLKGYFFITSVQHDCGGRSMSMDLEPVPADSAQQDNGKKEDSGEINKGDSIILNGAVYVDSYGNGKGQTFSNHKGTITIKVDTSRPCPYHVDGIGWVYPNSITKA